MNKSKSKKAKITRTDESGKSNSGQTRSQRDRTRKQTDVNAEITGETANAANDKETNKQDGNTPEMKQNRENTYPTRYYDDGGGGGGGGGGSGGTDEPPPIGSKVACAGAGTGTGTAEIVKSNSTADGSTIGSAL